MKKSYLQLLFFFPLLLLGACASLPVETGESTSPASKTPSFTQTPRPVVIRKAPQEVLDDIPGYHQSIPFDGIAPIYEPKFSSADESPLEDDELVMGVSINGEAKAYPISVLRFREMVNDELGGTPILTTW